MNLNFKNRKIVVYIALSHHTRFFIPVMKKLEGLGVQVIYIVGQGERSQELTAITLGLDFVHAFDYVAERDRPDVMENYRILRNGVAEGIKKDIAIGASNALTVLDKTLYAAATEYIGFKNFLKTEKPDICFALHELNRWGKLLGFWAKKMNIPFMTLQEGLYYNHDFAYIGHVQYSTLNLVWGRKTQQKLVGFEAPREKIIPVGNTHIAQEIERLEKEDVRTQKRQELGMENKRVALLLFSLHPSPIEDLEGLFDILPDNDHIQLICKFHPVATLIAIEEWKSGIAEHIRNRILFIHGGEDTYSLIAASDVCVMAEPSTTGLEVLAIGRPLIQLKLSKPDQYPYDFVEEKVALHLTPSELGDKLTQEESFSSFFSEDIIHQFIKDELHDTTGATERIISITDKVIRANSEGFPEPLAMPETDPETAHVWSVILLVPDNPETLFTILESISLYSENAGSYEVILVIQDPVPPDIQSILASLEGDVLAVSAGTGASITRCLNAGASLSQGRRCVFLGRQIAPSENWLKHLSAAYDRHEPDTIFGAKIISRHQNIVHAGMVVDANNAPVPAYQHLDDKFPSANKERPFQMLDCFLSMDRSFFDELGGFHPMAGNYGFMDLCLRARQKFPSSRAVYIPDIECLQMSAGRESTSPDDAIFFFSRWQGELWDSEADLYKSDNVSQLQLDSARMTRAMKMMGR